MKNLLLITAFLFLALHGFSQILTNSNLPIVIISTDYNPITGQQYEIPDEPKILAQMKIIYHPDGSRNYLTDQNNPDYLNYNGRIGIEIRGSSSQSLEKKPYGLTTFQSDDITKNDVSILGMPAENDWILYAINYDPSLIRSYFSYDLARSTGEYAPRGVYCEVIVNGDYKGLYVMMEKIKINSQRVDIVKMNNTDNSGRDLTGGYITKADKTTGGDPIAWTMDSYDGTIGYIHESPGPYEITPQQNTYIHTQFTNLQTAASARNVSIVNGYPSIIDIPSFVNYMIICELASNADSYTFSTYFHKDKLGKLRAGPVWDFDLTYGNDLFVWGYDRSHTDVWQFNDGGNTGSKFWRDLYNSMGFQCYLTRRWKELTAAGAPLSLTVLNAKIDAIVAHISEAVDREELRWQTIGNHGLEIQNMKNWLSEREKWMNIFLINCDACLHPGLPPLVISKINYNPVGTASLQSKDLEFIEITNTGTAEVDLTGIYLSELGVSYGFPAHSSLAAGSRLFLAGDIDTFKLVYGIDAFGQFSRNLSNDSEKLVLADAFGNVIDSVHYSSTSPWPVEANGQGYYLDLADLSLDNSLASSWTISSHTALEIPEIKQEEMMVYPNPVHNYLTIECEHEVICSYEIYDLNGRKVSGEIGLKVHQVRVNMEPYLPQVYMVRIRYESGSVLMRKVIKI